MTWTLPESWIPYWKAAMPLDVALIQMNSGPEIDANLNWAETQARAAARQGAQFILTPENTCHIRHPAAAKLQSAPAEEDHPALPRFGALAKELGVSILLGSISINLGDRIANRSYCFDPEGRIAASYDKIHLFDVALPGNENYKESDLVKPGDKAVIADLPFGKVGLTICYDIRFPHLYRALAQNGASIITVPAAFTVQTGQAHWKPLLQARAIETGCYILAPAQMGEHEGGRRTWGHSMVVDPWGKVETIAEDKPGILRTQLDLDRVAQVRMNVPSLQHDRAFTL